MEPTLAVGLGRAVIQDQLPEATWYWLQRYPTAWNPEEDTVTWWIPERDFLFVALQHPDLPWQIQQIQGQ